MLETFTKATFDKHVGKSFGVHAASGETLEAELISVTDLGTKGLKGAKQPARTPFSIVFRIPGETDLKQGMHRFDHPEIGAFDLFTVPIGRDEDGLLCEAIFN